VLTDSIRITSQLCKLMMPSAFTPNKDGLNDVFKVKYPFPVKHFDMIVYNRFGQKVFECYDIAKGWNGTINNVDQDAGMYIWKISLIDNDGISAAAQGTVTMIR
jgi:gliding motility-associated-like protein